MFDYFVGLALKELTIWKIGKPATYLEDNEIDFLAKRTDIDGPRFHGNCTWVRKLSKSCSKMVPLFMHA